MDNFSSPLQQTTKIVAAFVGNNTVAAADLPNLIKSIYASLCSVSEPAPPPPERAAPAVTIKKSVTPSAIICLECGKSQSMMKRHIGTAHGLTVEEYKTKWALPSDYPMVAPEYAAHRSELAKKIGLGTKPRKRAPKAKE